MVAKQKVNKVYHHCHKSKDLKAKVECVVTKEEEEELRRVFQS